MDENWRPLSVREGRARSKAFDTLHDAIPSWVRESVINWALERIGVPNTPREREVLHKIQVGLRLEIHSSEITKRLISNDDDFVLDVVDFLSGCRPDSSRP